MYSTQISKRISIVVRKKWGTVEHKSLSVQTQSTNTFRLNWAFRRLQKVIFFLLCPWCYFSPLQGAWNPSLFPLMRQDSITFGCFCQLHNLYCSFSTWHNNFIVILPFTAELLDFIQIHSNNIKTFSQT